MEIAFIQYETPFLGGFVNKFYAVFAAVVVAVGFQNCSPSSMDSGFDMMGSDIAIGTGKTANLGANTLNVDLRDTSTLEVLHPLEAPTAPDSTTNDQKIVVELHQGVIQIKSSDGSLVAERCLPSNLQQEIAAVLHASRLCENQVTESICAQRYQEGYATIVVNGFATSLGEKRDSCGTGTKDLCGESSAAFKGIVKYIRSSWSTFDCP